MKDIVGNCDLESCKLCGENLENGIESYYIDRDIFLEFTKHFDINEECLEFKIIQN